MSKRRAILILCDADGCAASHTVLAIDYESQAPDAFERHSAIGLLPDGWREELSDAHDYPRHHCPAHP